ncbi:MAG TPA: energy transducer TonB [Rhodospirillaceae bacterium]|nr:energy transducer TonB [Rhodospirillaceae bacterium]
MLGRIERYKRYPYEAKRTQREGTAVVRFSIDRSGRLLAARLEVPSGIESLDYEALALMARAEPFPEPPADVPGQNVELIVPIQFTLKVR